MKTPMQRTDGIALIATILILAMCFSSLLTVLSLTSLSLKRGGKTQYHSYQALLAAESGVNSFTARGASNLFDTSQDELSLDDLNDWLIRNNLDELKLLEGNQSILNKLRFSNLTTQSATLESIGTVYSQFDGETLTLAKKVLRVDFKLHAVGSQLRIQPSAALTTLGNLELEGDAQLTGATAQEISGLIRDYDQARAHPTPLANSTKVQLRIQHPNRFHSGQYIALNSGRYKVTTVDKNANVLELLPLNFTNTEIFEDLENNEIALIPLALTSDIPSTNARTIELPINSSHGQTLVTGQSISINDYLATIESITSDSITITWTSTIPNQVLAEGSTVSLGILGARASQSISTEANSNLVGGKEQNATLSTTNLFENTFGLSKDELLGSLNNYNQRSGKSFDLQSANELQAVAKLNGLYYTEDTLYFDASNPLCGEAILISSDNISVNHVCDDGFSGLLYTFGNYTQTAGHIDGAIISEEETTLSSTSANTTLSSSANITYNANALGKWQNYMQDSMATQDGKQDFQQVVGSWRLE